jgi:hypothetical protein
MPAKISKAIGRSIAKNMSDVSLVEALALSVEDFEVAEERGL